MTRIVRRVKGSGILGWVLAGEAAALVVLGLQISGWSYLGLLKGARTNVPTSRHPLHVVCFDGRDHPVYEANVSEASTDRDVNALHFTELGTGRVDMINADDICRYTPAAAKAE
jgi:hypothetical protein